MKGHYAFHFGPNEYEEISSDPLNPVIPQLIMSCKQPELSELCRDDSKHFTPHAVVRSRQISGLLFKILT